MRLVEKRFERLTRRGLGLKTGFLPYLGPPIGDLGVVRSGSLRNLGEQLTEILDARAFRLRQQAQK